MNLSKLAAIALAALLVTAGAAAATPGNAPDHSGADEHEQASEHQPDTTDNSTNADENATRVDEDAADMRENSEASSNQRADAAQGPPTDMPGQVPDHVVEIHRLILNFLSGDLDGPLGPSVSDVTPDEDSGNATADASG